MTGFKDLLGIEESCTTTYVTFGNGKKGKIIGTGNLISNDLPYLNNVLLVKGLTTNLISISQLCDEGMSVNFSKSVCFVTNEKGEVIMRGIKYEGNCYLWIPLSKDQTKKLTRYNQVMISEKRNCVFQCTVEDKLITVDGIASKPVRMEEMSMKCNVEQNVLTL